MADKKRKSQRSTPVKEAPLPQDEASPRDHLTLDEIIEPPDEDVVDESHVPAEEIPVDVEFVEGDEYDDADGEHAEDPPQEEISADEENPPRAHKVTRQEVLVRLLEKNEMILKLSKEKAVRDSQLKELNNKWIRSVAEFENYRKRSRKEWELLKQQAKAEVILDILHVVDDFERAFAVAEDTNSSEFVQGIKLIYNNLTHILDRTGVTEVVALHEPFDPNFHMAVGQIEASDIESGHVVEVVQKGYLLDDLIIRPANVIVAK